MYCELAYCIGAVLVIVSVRGKKNVLVIFCISHKDL